MARGRKRPPIIGLLLVVCALFAGCVRPSPATRAEQSLSADIAAAMTAQSGFDNIRAILVVQNGRTVFKHYFDTTPEQTWNVASVTKSVLSTLVGIALDEGRFSSLDEPLKDLLPAYAPDMTPVASRTTLRQLLTMTAGLPGSLTNEQRVVGFSTKPDWVRAIVRSIPPAEAPPRFTDSDADAHLVAAALEQATGQSVLDYARAKLFGPLGIDTRPAAQPVADLSEPTAATVTAGFAWPVDPQGVNLGWTQIRMRPKDMVKIGQLYLHSGRWNGHQVVSSSWVQQATAPQVPDTGVRASVGPDNGYGYLWWVETADGDSAYFAHGVGGQLVELIPARGLEVVVVSEFDPTDPNSHGTPAGLLMSLVNDTIAPHFQW